MHCNNCNKKCYFKAGYKYGYCQSNKECKKLYLIALKNDPKHKEYLKQYFSTEHGKQKRREAKQRCLRTGKEEGSAEEEETKRKAKSSEVGGEGIDETLPSPTSGQSHRHSVHSSTPASTSLLPISYTSKKLVAPSLAKISSPTSAPKLGPPSSHGSRPLTRYHRIPARCCHPRHRRPLDPRTPTPHRQRRPGRCSPVPSRSTRSLPLLFRTPPPPCKTAPSRRPPVLLLPLRPILLPFPRCRPSVSAPADSSLMRNIWRGG